MDPTAAGALFAAVALGAYLIYLIVGQQPPPAA